MCIKLGCCCFLSLLQGFTLQNLLQALGACVQVPVVDAAAGEGAKADASAAAKGKADAAKAGGKTAKAEAKAADAEVRLGTR